MSLANPVGLSVGRGHVSRQQLAKVAAQAYRGARLRAGLARAWALLRGRRSGLWSLEHVLSERAVRGSHHGGIRPVALAQIRGSEGRCEDFDAAFRPLKEHNRGKWMSVALARLQGVALPVVKLAQVGDSYFVLDGHHRISVARAFGQESIDAEITVWEVDGRSAPAPAAAHLEGAHQVVPLPRGLVP
jgi:hypothetical protein